MFNFPFCANSFKVRKTSRAGVLKKDRVSDSCINKKTDKLTSHNQGNLGLSHLDVKESQTSLRASSSSTLGWESGSLSSSLSGDEDSLSSNVLFLYRQDMALAESACLDILWSSA